MTRTVQLSRQLLGRSRTTVNSRLPAVTIEPPMSTELLRESTVPSAMPMTMVRKAHPEEAHRRLAEAATTNAQTASRTKLGSIRRRLIPPLSQELTESHGVRGGPQRRCGRPAG